MLTKLAVSPDVERRFGWQVVGLLFAASVVNYTDRAALSVVVPQIREELSLSNADYGLAVNAFLIMYTVFYVVGGRLADRLGCRRTLSITVLFWSIANMLHALSRGLTSLCAYRALLGVGEGGFYPTAIRGAAEWFREENRAKAVGLLLCGVSVGSMLSPPLVAWVTLQFGWRAAFVVTGALGLLLLPFWFALHARIRRVYGESDPAPAYHIEQAAGSETGSQLSLGQALARRKYWMLLTARAITDPVWYFYLFWMPAYFQDVRGFSLAMVGSLLWIPYLAADVGALGGAWASSTLIRRGLGLDRSRKLVLIASALLALAGPVGSLVEGRMMALGLISLALLANLSWASNLHTTITEVVPRGHVAVLYGLTGAVGTVMGAISQPLIGRAVDAIGYGPAFLGCAACFLTGIVMLIAAGRIEPIR